MLLEAAGLACEVILIALFLSASLGDEPCVIPPGPPCISVSDSRLKDPSCVFSVGSCISLRWDEYAGQSIVEEALIIVSPTCGDSSSSLRLERKGRDYILAMQSVPVSIRSEIRSCSKIGFVDVEIVRSFSP